MSTMTHTTTTRRIARAEWTKLRTLPSTWRTAALSTVMAIGFEVAVAYSEASQWHTITAQQRQASSCLAGGSTCPASPLRRPSRSTARPGCSAPPSPSPGTPPSPWWRRPLRASYRDA